MLELGNEETPSTRSHAPRENVIIYDALRLVTTPAERISGNHSPLPEKFNVVQWPEYKKCLAYDVFFRDKLPHPTIIAVSAVITKHKIIGIA